jgi:hypothetical protein
MLMSNDVDMWLGGGVAVMIPVSTRAKELLALPDDVNGVMILGDPSQVLGLFPEDFTFLETEEAPERINITGLVRLH